ncbi:efflux RND transporter periplasmic adaptor subunit [Citreimonas salinaria]|uniref:RND family efflux transporter, MFP subunit n=1 Tax=Citreimonas salinaria TaxID=321339 RepID=A0A1H3F626_9RHOB|nr:efflux RND transporter periplasmic adaptor subunit [Citreimonas salinaria]SDX85609.1 RND family efflux transporter, MFP subunit [Citreimonas salinaria]
MAILKQIILSAVVIAAALFLWITFVPSSGPWLERAGLADLLGVEAAQPQGGEGGRGGWGGGGAARVVVAEVTEGAVDDRIEAIGDGQALRAVTLRTEVSGQIVELPVAGGTYVEEGALILRLDSEAERIALERARLMLDEARDDAERLEQLADAGTVSGVRQREARLALRTAELEVQQAEYDLGRRTLRAPIAGWNGVLDLEQGDRVPAQAEIGTITDRSAILIDFRVPESAVSRIDVGTPLTARPLGIPDLVLDGRIAAIDNVVDRSSRTLRVQGRVANENDRLRAGMAFKVQLRFSGQALPAIDPLAVQWSSQGSYVWVVRDGKAQRVDVTIRQRNADSVVVEAALEPGDPVVIEGVQSLRPGADVEVVEGSAATGQAALDGPARL